MKQYLPGLLFLLLTACLFLGCFREPYHPAWFTKVSVLREPIGPEEIFRLPEGEQISFFRLLEELGGLKVIFVGEAHDQREHHHIQLRVLRGLVEKGENLAVAMEMFERSRQPVLDQWSQGVLTEEEFLKRVEWETSWGIDYDLYRGILDEIRSRNLKLLGLNVDRELVREVARSGVEGLSHDDKKRLPEMDLSDRAHRAYIASIYAKHTDGEAKSFDHFYEAQSLWDEGMAETLSDYLKSEDGRGKAILVLAGNGHVSFDFGIPKRLYRRVSLPQRTVVLTEWRKDLDGNLLFQEAPSPIADYLWITKPALPERKRPKIGVFLKKKGDQGELWIERTVPESPAEKAGLLPGDQIVAIDAKEVARLKEFQAALLEKGWGKEVTLTILREGKKKEIRVILPPQSE